MAILSPEASVVHQRRIAEQPQGFGETTRLQIEAGFAVPATAYVRAQQFRRDLVGRFRALFAEVDALLSPAVPWVAPAEDPMLNDEAGAGEMLYSAVYNLVGLPAVSVPCGLSSGGLPMGLQIVGTLAGGRARAVDRRGAGSADADREAADLNRTFRRDCWRAAAVLRTK